MVRLSELGLGVKTASFLEWRTRVRGKEKRRTGGGWYPGRKRRFSFLDSLAKRYISRSLGKRTVVLIGPPNGGYAHSRSHRLELLSIATHPALAMRMSIFKIGEVE